MNFIVKARMERSKKIVMFTKMQDDPPIYNLAFGDEDPETGCC